MLIFKQQVNGDLLDLSTFRSTPRALVTRPALVLSACYKFSLVWWGSEMHGCCPSVQVHRPRPSDPDTFIIGDAGVYGGNSPTGAAVIVKSINDPDHRLIRRPLGWTQVWNDQGSGGSDNGAVWSAEAPDGFVGIGAVASLGYDAPIIPNYGCINTSLLTQVTSGLIPIWKDQGSLAHQDVEFWAAPRLPNAFVTSNTYDAPPPEGVYVFRCGR